MSIKNRQIIIAISFACLSVLTYMLGLKMDYGSVSVSANTSSFDYSINNSNHSCQKTSCTHSLRPKTYTLSAQKDGFFDIQQELRIVQGQGLEKQLTFIPKPVLKEISSPLQAEFQIENGKIISIQPETLQKQTILKLDPSKKVRNIDYSSSFNQLIVQYQDASYFYDLTSNKSFELKFLDAIQPISIALFSKDSALIQNDQKQVFTQLLSPELIVLDQGSQFISTNHYLDIDGGYLAILPSSKQQSGNFSFQDLANKTTEIVDSKNLIESFRKQVKSLFYFSNQTNNLYELRVLDTTNPDEVSLSKAIIDSSSSPILQVRNTIYQIQL